MQIRAKITEGQIKVKPKDVDTVGGFSLSKPGGYLTKSKVLYMVAFFAVGVLLSVAVNAQAVSEDARRHMARGQAAVEMAKSPVELEDAIKEFQEAARLEPTWPDPYYNLGLTQEKAGKLREAAASFKKYLQLAPNVPDAAKIQEQIYKLEYKAEKILTVPEIIDVLVSFSDKQKWQEYDGKCENWRPESFDFKRECDDTVKSLKDIHSQSWKYPTLQTLKVTGPVLKYITTENMCDAEADRQLGGCDLIIEEEVEVVSKTLVKINQKIIRGGPLWSSVKVGDKYSCKYRKK